VPRKPTGQPPGRPRKPAPTPGVIPKLTRRQWRALKHELSLIGDVRRVTFADINGLRLFRGSVRRLGQRLGVSHNAIHKWRRDPAYRQGFFWALGRSIARKFPRSIKRKPVTARTKGEADGHLYADLVKASQGPILSPLDGKLYADAAAYLKHVRGQKNALWHGDKPISWFLSKSSNEEDNET
jgi:hypothetical protein